MDIETSEWSQCTNKAKTGHVDGNTKHEYWPRKIKRVTNSVALCRQHVYIGWAKPPHRIPLPACPAILGRFGDGVANNLLCSHQLLFLSIFFGSAVSCDIQLGEPMMLAAWCHPMHWFFYVSLQITSSATFLWFPPNADCSLYQQGFAALSSQVLTIVVDWPASAHCRRSL